MYSRKNKRLINKNELVKSEKILKSAKRKKLVKKVHTNIVKTDDYNLKNEVKIKLSSDYKYDKKKYIADNLAIIKKIKSDLQVIEKTNIEQNSKMQVSYEENLKIETKIDKLKKDIGNTIIRSRYLYDSLFLLEEEVANREKAIIESNDNRKISFEITKLEKQIEKIIKEAEQILNVENIFIFNEVEKTIKEKLTSELSSYPDMDENTLEKTIVLVEQKISDNLQQQKDIYQNIFHLEKKQLENNEKILASEDIIEENNKEVKTMNDNIKRFEKTNTILRKYK